MPKPIRWGILGTGVIAHDFAEALHALPDAKLIAAASRDQAKADSFARKNGVPKAYGSYEALVNDPEIDIIYVATPHHRHRDDMLLCLNHGKHVLCEKPFTMNAAEAREVAAVARAKKLFCMEAMWMRFIPLVQTAKRMVAEGKIGTPLTLMADFGGPTPFDPANRFFNAKMGGGALLDRGVYLVSFAYFLFGKPANIVTSAAIGETGVDDQSAMIFTYADGKQAVLHSSLRVKSPTTATIMGTHGSITMAESFFCTQQLTFKPETPPMAYAGGVDKRSAKKRIIALIKSLPVIGKVARKVNAILKGSQVIRQPHKGSGYRFEAAEAMECLRKGLTESPHMPLDETIEIMQTMDDIQAMWRK